MEAPIGWQDRGVGALGAEYGRTRARLSALLAELDDEAWAAPVPACPGWDVRAVASHLLGTVEDVAAGRITGPPPPEVTAAQVARHRATPRDELLARWAEGSPAFEEVVTAFSIWPAVLDVLSHEHDVRHACGRPGERDDPLVGAAAVALAEALDAPLAVDLGDGPIGPDGADLVLRTTPFELLRLRLGRRSRDQVRALDWSADPGPVLDALFVFGPRDDALVE